MEVTETAPVAVLKPHQWNLPTCQFVPNCEIISRSQLAQIGTFSYAKSAGVLSSAVQTVDLLFVLSVSQHTNTCLEAVRTQTKVK